MSEEHETFIKTPKQLIIAIVLSFVIPILLIALLVKYVGQSDRIGAGANAMTEQATADRIRPTASYELASAPETAKAHNGSEVYAAQCAVCHDAGVAGAPKFGDKDIWGPRIAAGGLGGLIGSALKGKGAMAAQSGGKYSDLEIAKAVVHMANRGGADFNDPTAESMAGKKTPAPVQVVPEKKTESSVGAATAASAAAATTAAVAAVAAAKPATGTTATPSIVNRARESGTSVAKEATKAASPAAQVTPAARKAPMLGASKEDNSDVSRVAAATAATAVAAPATTQAVAPTTSDNLLFADAAEVAAATGKGIPKRLSIFFDSGSSEVSEKAADDLWQLIYFTKSGDWSRIGLSGFTDGTGNKEINERLSRQRMGKVRDLLVDIGVAEDRIVMVKPEQVEAASGASKNARRVDVFHAK